MLHPLILTDLDDVLAIERIVHPVPWTKENFVDVIAENYDAQVCRDGAHRIEGYCVTMDVVDEVHLLNITVHPHWQRRGIGTYLFHHIFEQSQARGMPSILLEVRESNHAARDFYTYLGFVEIGQRQGYYRTNDGNRETARVMRWRLDNEPPSKSFAGDIVDV